MLPVVAVLVGAPLSAEYLQAYLATTGQALALVGGVVFFAPLYGGAALLIREVALRTGRGWPCRLLLAAAFGLAMTGVVDLSLFGRSRADIPYWEQLRAPTAIDALGLSVAPALTWVAGHVVMSVGAPLALLDALAPSHRGRPLLGRWGTAALALAGAGVAAFVFVDGRRTYGYVPTWWQAGAVLAVVALLIVLAVRPPARAPRAPAGQARAARPVPAAAVLGLGGVGKVALDVIPPTWPGVALDLGVLAAVVVSVAWWDRHRLWGPREIGLLGGVAVLAGAVLGFTTPVPDGGSPLGKNLQSALFVVVALALVVLVLRRTPGRAPRT